MRTRFLAAAAAAVLCLPVATHASTITWSVSGVVDQQTGLDARGIKAGDSFSFLLRFDSAAPLLNSPSCDSLPGPCRYDGISITLLGIRVGPVGPLDSDFDLDDPGQIIVRNNDPIGNDPTPWDGVSFSRSDLGEVYPGNDVRSQDTWGILFRTTDTSFWNSSVIPTDPTGFAQMALSAFQLCGATRSDDATNCDRNSLNGTITHVSLVPEPASLALFGLGLAGLGAGRRRRPN